MEEAFDLFTNNPLITFNTDDPEHIQWLVDEANNRNFIFETNNKGKTRDMFG